MSSSPVTLQRIAQVAVPVSDLERSIAFYHHTLGLPLLYAQHNMALLDCAGIRLLLSMPEDGETNGGTGSTIYFQVEELQDTCNRLAEAGVTFRGKPHKIAEFGGYAVWMAFFYDPDRNLHALTSEIPLGS